MLIMVFLTTKVLVRYGLLYLLTFHRFLVLALVLKGWCGTAT